ncbi:hypothetical protein KCP74_00170 [Salmonella enterica subsp. enterica]|nr:hypothetical protein KCP74_00170 [Salmonella enterica subsp. enterica]
MSVKQKRLSSVWHESSVYWRYGPVAQQVLIIRGGENACRQPRAVAAVSREHVLLAHPQAIVAGKSGRNFKIEQYWGNRCKFRFPA